jgi:hypothetical protein
MGADARLKGQEVSIRVIQAGTTVKELDSIASFNDNTVFEIKEDGFLGESVNRFDTTLSGYGGDFEFQTTGSKYWNLILAIEKKATREDPTLIFNVVRTDFYANGQSAVITYSDVSWGAFPTNVPKRDDFVKIKAEFKTSKRTIQIDAV